MVDLLGLCSQYLPTPVRFVNIQLGDLEAERGSVPALSRSSSGRGAGVDEKWGSFLQDQGAGNHLWKGWKNQRWG